MHSFKLRNPFGEQPAIFEWQENFKVPVNIFNLNYFILISKQFIKNILHFLKV